MNLVSDSPTVQAAVVPDGVWPLTLLEVGTAGLMGPAPPKPPPTETIAIIVQNSLYASVSAQVTQYRQDLNNSGYSTILYTTLISTHQRLKGNLTQWYNSNGLVGAVLIGALPFAWFYHPANSSFSAETFICDLYLMDLDGSWWDINTDGVYDKHNASAGCDIYPEIFVSRIDASTRTLGAQSNAVNIGNLLGRLHTYRTGGPTVSRSNRALTYIDDSWQAWANGTYDDWPGWLNNAYSNRTDIHTPRSWTNASDWLNNRIVQDYEWAHLCAHSTPTSHVFGPSGSEGTVTSAQIHNKGPQFNFYNLFCCDGADWTTSNCLATTYLFSGNRSLAVVGTTKTGGMLGGSSFYNALGQDRTIGEALSNWFQGMKSYASSDYLGWFYGMCILGDPFVTIRYDCTALPPVISSSTHPSSSSWYSNARPQFNWTVPRDVNGIVGYYYVIDQNPSSIPGTLWGTYTTINGTQPVSTLTDGSWYLHVVSKDAVGNVGTTAAHYQVNIDTTSPITFFSSPFPLYNSSTNVVGVVWAGLDFASGYASSQVWLDTASNIVYTGPQLNYTLTSLAEGLHIINVTTWDNVGNRGSNQITIRVDLTDPTGNILSPANGTATAASFVLVWSVSDGQSGYYRTEVRVDGVVRTTVNAPATSTMLSGLTLGAHTINVTIYDWAGRFTSDQISIQVNTSTPPPIPGFPWEGLVVGLVAAVVATLFVRRRRR